MTRMLGLRNVDDLTRTSADPNAPHWAKNEAYVDRNGRRWNKLNVGALLADEVFMDIGE